MGKSRMLLACLAIVFTGFPTQALFVTAQEATPEAQPVMGSYAGYRGDAARTGSTDDAGPDGPGVLWRIENGDWSNTPATGGGLVVTSGDAGLNAFDAETGERVWHVDQIPAGSAPVIAGDMVYDGSGHGFHAYDLATGAERWEFLNGIDASAYDFDGEFYDSSAAYLDGTLYIGGGPQNSFIFAIDAATGQEQWRFPLHGGGPGSPAVADGVVYLGSETINSLPDDDPAPTRFYAVDAATGEQRWRVEMAEGETIFSSPAVSDGTVVVGVVNADAGKGIWMAFNAKTGERRWEVETVQPTWWASAAIADGVAYLPGAESKQLFAVDLVTGAELWSYDTGTGQYTPATVAAGVVYLPIDDGRLAALDAKSGKELWTINFGMGGNSATIADGKLFIGRGTLLYALTDSANPAALELAAPPAAPIDGPGSEPSAFVGVRTTKYGPDPGGFWIWEPTTRAGDSTSLAQGPFPVILYLSGCCGNGDFPTPEEVDPWMQHLARQGYIVIAPVYNANTVLDDIPTMLRQAMDELKKEGHSTPNYDKFGVIGFSYGGTPAVIYAGTAKDAGLPVPSALFIDAPCEGGDFCPALPADLSLPADLKSVVLTFSDDYAVGSDAAKTLWAAMDSVPLENRDFVTMTTDIHGMPPIVASHETTFQTVDGADWYGIWKLSTALFACAFTGQSCEHALGNTAEQTSMGTWSDGVAVAPLVVTDDPGPPPVPEVGAPDAEATPAA